MSFVHDDDAIAGAVGRGLSQLLLDGQVRALRRGLVAEVFAAAEWGDRYSMPSLTADTAADTAGLQYARDVI